MMKLVVFATLALAAAACSPPGCLNTDTAAACSPPGCLNMDTFFQNARDADWRVHDRMVDEDVSIAAAATTRIVFAVKQNNVDVLEEFALAVSDPKNPKFGQHLSHAAMGELIANPKSTDAVISWLLQAGVTRDQITATPHGEFIMVKMPIMEAERAFGGQFYRFTRERPVQPRKVPDTVAGMLAARLSAPPLVIYRTAAHGVPAHILEHVDFISGLNDFPAPQSPGFFHSGPVDMNQASDVTGIPAGYTQPSTLLNYYKLTRPTVASSQSTMSLFESLGQSYSPQDLTSFQQYFNLPTQAVSNVIGPNDPSACGQSANNCAEASLDVQYIMAIAQGAPTTFWSVANSDSPYLDFLVAVAGASNPPLVHSMSYGSIEKATSSTVLDRFEQEMMKLAGRGITLIVASGDDGVANFQARGDQSKCGFNPSYPATSAWVTAVGATQGPENSQNEVAESSSTGGLITTGGGFSSHYSQPSWQSSAVQSYLQSQQQQGTLPPSSQFSSGNRGYPDVAVLGHNYVIADGGSLTAVSGTSAAAPVFAGMIAQANGHRLARGKSAIGFLNQILYSSDMPSDAFTDITSGENNCCAGQPGQQVCCQYGFTADQGWDPLTGLGSPVADILIDNLATA